MELDTAENLWRCGITDCKVIGRPKNLHDTGDTIIGRGEISLRVLRHDTGEVDKIVLMAKNNVLLDITDQVNAAVLLKCIHEQARDGGLLWIPFTTLPVWEGES